MARGKPISAHVPGTEPGPGPAHPAALSYEQAVAELEAIIDRIERGEVGLEQSISEYRRGTELLKRCRAILDVAEQQVQDLTAGEDEKA